MMLDLHPECFANLPTDFLMRTLHLNDGEWIGVQKIAGDIYIYIHDSPLLLDQSCHKRTNKSKSIKD
jgi:hypothetical protein